MNKWEDVWTTDDKGNDIEACVESLPDNLYRASWGHIEGDPGDTIDEAIKNLRVAIADTRNRLHD